MKKTSYTKEVNLLHSKLVEAISALKVIRTWATFKGGVMLEPKSVGELCDKTLDKINK